MPEGAAGAELRCDLQVFDLDGTLIDSQQDLAHSVNATLLFVHRPPLEHTLIASFIGDGATALLQRALDATGGADDALLLTAMPFFLAYYREHNLDFTAAYPGVLSELRRIREAAPLLPMAVLTNKPVNPSRAICAGLGLSPFFFQNYGGDSFVSKKPDPLGMHTLMHEAATLLGHEVQASRTVLIGDSHVDVETARAAGTLCLGCSYGLDPERLKKARPDVLVDTPHQWLDALRTLLS